MQKFPFGIIPARTLVLLLVAGAIASRLQAKGLQTVPADRSVWDSVYSNVQADAGKLLYDDHCSSCHGANLEGGRALALRDDAFLRDWGGDTLGRFYRRMKTSMPKNAPASLKDDDYLALVAYILKVNTLPAGNESLAAEYVDQIQVYGKGGPASVPDFALVTVVGCLIQREGGDWTVIKASSPVMTRDPAASTNGDLKRVEAKSLGTETFQLVNVFPPPEHDKGHKIEAKGFLMRSSASTGISITSIQTVAALCDR